MSKADDIESPSQHTLPAQVPPSHGRGGYNASSVPKPNRWVIFLSPDESMPPEHARLATLGFDFERRPKEVKRVYEIVEGHPLPSPLLVHALTVLGYVFIFAPPEECKDIVPFAPKPKYDDGLEF